MDITTRACDGILNSPLGPVPFKVDNGTVQLSFSSYDYAIKWMALAEVVVLTAEHRSTKKEPAPVAVAPAVTPPLSTPVPPPIVTAPAPVAVLVSPDAMFGEPLVATNPPPAAAPVAAEAPKKRGRPPGSKNTPKATDATPTAPAPVVATVTAPAPVTPTYPPGYVAPQPAPGITYPPGYTAPTVTAAPAMVAPPVVVPQTPSVPQSTKKNIKIGNVAWGVEVVETMVGYDAHCTQLKTLVATGSSEEEALINIRQVIASYMAAQMPTTAPADTTGPVEVVKVAPTPPPAPPVVMEAPAPISDRVMQAGSPSDAVSLYVTDLVEDDVDITIPAIVEKIRSNWSAIPALRIRNLLPTEMITGLVTTCYSKLMAEFEGAA